MVLLENVSATNLRPFCIRRLQLRDVQPVLVALDFFLKHIHADVIAFAEPTVCFAHEHLDEARPWRPLPHFIAQLIRQHIAH